MKKISIGKQVLNLVALSLSLSTISLVHATQTGHHPQHLASIHADKTVKVELKSSMQDGKMIFLAPNGQPNPTIKANVGDKVELKLISGEGAQHDFMVPDLNIHSRPVQGQHGSTVLRFTATKPGSYNYYCSIPGHKDAGMEGTIVIGPKNGAKS